MRSGWIAVAVLVAALTFELGWISGIRSQLRADAVAVRSGQEGCKLALTRFVESVDPSGALEQRALAAPICSRAFFESANPQATLVLPIVATVLLVLSAVAAIVRRLRHNV